MSVPWNNLSTARRGKRPLHSWTQATPCGVQDEASSNLWCRIKFVRCCLLSVCESVLPSPCTGFFFVLGFTLLWSYATERLLTHASPLYEGTTGAAVRGFFLQTRTALLALAVGLDGPQGRKHRLRLTIPRRPRSVPERLHKCRTSWVVSGSA